MFVKTPAKVSGIPSARVAVSPGVTDYGMPQVTALISAVDTYDMPTVVASLRMSSAEAREVAARLLRDADAADCLRDAGAQPMSDREPRPAVDLNMTADRDGVDVDGHSLLVKAGDTVEYRGHVVGGMIRVSHADGTEVIVHPYCFAQLR